MRDLLDREGIAIVATHPGDLGETTMIFSPDTGALLGEEYLWAPDAESEPELTGLTAVVDERIVNALP